MEELCQSQWCTKVLCLHSYGIARLYSLRNSGSNFYYMLITIRNCFQITTLFKSQTSAVFHHSIFVLRLNIYFVIFLGRVGSFPPDVVLCNSIAACDVRLIWIESKLIWA